MVSGVGNSRKGYRGRLEIIRDILLVVGDDGSKKTHIMYRANLSYNLLKSYLECVSEAGLVEFDDAGGWYTITEKGERFLELYKGFEDRSRRVEEQLEGLNSWRATLEKLLVPDGEG